MLAFKAKRNSKMQKQTAPSINAHLLRGALILASLVAVCTTPFALVGGVFSGGGNTNAIQTAVGGATPTPTPSGSPCAVRAYIPNSSSNNVSVIDTSTNTVVATVSVGANPQGVAVNPAGTRAYITNGTSDTVSVIDTATNTVVTTIPVGDSPQGVAVN